MNQSKIDLKKVMNSKAKKKSFWKKFSEKNWFAPDLPGGEARFQTGLFAKWILIFLGLPIAGFAIAFVLATASETKKTFVPHRSSDFRLDASKSQIIDFRGGGTGGTYAGYAQRSPGTLVRVKLLNSVEGIGNAPVYAQILDGSLGRNLLGGTLLGDASGDPNLNRITITFNFARDPSRMNVAVPLKARALALNGTLGISANKKEGIIARSALGGGAKITQDAQGSVDSFDIRQIFMKALATGFLSEAGGGIGVEKNRAALLTLPPDTEFFAELTDNFPGASK